METYYEVREAQAPGSRPEEKGAIISLHRTFAEAMKAAAEQEAKGRKVAVHRSEGWLK